MNLTAFGEQVEDDLADPALVSFDGIDRRIGRELDANALVARALAHHDHAALEGVAQRERRDLELDLACLDLREIEHVVDQRQQVVGGGEDVVEVLLLLRVQLAEHALAQDLGEADDRVQRRA